VLNVPVQLSQFAEVNKCDKEKSKITKYTAEKNGYNNEQLYKITNNTNEKKSKLRNNKQVYPQNKVKKSSS
jgi:hypothetical protein